VFVERERTEQHLARAELFEKHLENLQRDNISLAEFLEHVFDPETKSNVDWRWKGKFLRV
jgi:hypothetical protein